MQTPAFFSNSFDLDLLQPFSSCFVFAAFLLSEKNFFRDLRDWCWFFEVWDFPWPFVLGGGRKGAAERLLEDGEGVFGVHC